MRGVVPPPKRYGRRVGNIKVGGMLENLTHPLQRPIFETTNKNGGGADPTTGPTPPPHFKETVGSALLSHNPPVAVPSAQKGLTSRFGKDTGCNPLAKTTNTTNKQHPKKGGDHSPVSETIYPHVPTQPTNPQKQGSPSGRVGREPHSGRKHHQKQELLLVIGQLVLVSWSPYNVYTPSLSTR